LLEFDSTQISVKGWGLRGEISKNSSLAQSGPLLRHGYLPLVLSLPGRLTCGQIAAIYLMWTV